MEKYQKWLPIIESAIESAKKEKEYKMCEYAEHHAIHESMVEQSTLCNCLITPEVLSTLSVSLKILAKFSLINDFSKVHILSGPRQEIGDKTICVGTHQIKTEIDPSLSLEETHDIIKTESIKYLEKNNDKTIYIYKIVDNIKRIQESSGGCSLVWNIRVQFEN